MNYSSKTKGDIGEFSVITEILKLGWNVLTPVGNNLPYDLVIEVNKKFVKIQVKCAYFYRNGYLLNTKRAKTNRKEYKFEEYKKDDFDFAIGFILEKNDFYIYPVDHFIKFKGGKLRIGNRGTSEFYKNNWKLIDDYVCR